VKALTGPPFARRATCFNRTTNSGVSGIPHITHSRGFVAGNPGLMVGPLHTCAKGLLPFLLFNLLPPYQPASGLLSPPIIGPGPCVSGIWLDVDGADVRA